VKEGGVGGKKTPSIPESEAIATTPLSSKLLHEKLSHYLDVIEVHLIHQIAQRSDLFFSTLSAQQEMQTHIMTVRQNVMELRLCLHELDKKLTHKSLELMQLCTQRHRHAQVLQKLKFIATVQQTQPTIQLLLSTSDFVGAIDLITTTQDVLQQELRGVHSLRHLGSQLAEMERAIERMMEADLVSFAMEDIALRGRAISNHSLTSDVSSSEERLVSVVYGLLMQGKLHFLTALREGILTRLKTFVKETVKTYLHIPEVEGEGVDSPSLADCMRGMEFEAWLAMMEHLFASLLNHLKTVQSCVKVIASVCERAAGHDKVGGATHQKQQQQSHDQSTTTAMVKDTLRKGSVSMATATPPPSSSSLTNFQFKPPTSPSPLTNSGLPSLDSFEVSTARHEAEDQLELLMMEEEMSNLRLGATSPENSWTSTDPSQRPSGSSGAATSAEFITSDTAGDRIAHSSNSESGLQAAVAPHTGAGVSSVVTGVSVGGRAVVASTAGVGQVRVQQLTVDGKEKERLEDIMAVAHVGDSSQVISHTECHRLVTECHDLLAASCDLVHSRCAKILSIRAKAGLLENVVSSEFVSLVRLIERFVHSCTEVTGRQCPTLRSSLLSQAKVFVEHFHENRKSKVSLLLDGERWKQTDVPAEIQALVHRLEDGIPPLPGGRRESSPELVQSGRSVSKYLVVHSQNFAVLG
jgi:hypothetical protein